MEIMTADIVLLQTTVIALATWVFIINLKLRNLKAEVQNKK